MATKHTYGVKRLEGPKGAKKVVWEYEQTIEKPDSADDNAWDALVKDRKSVNNLAFTAYVIWLQGVKRGIRDKAESQKWTGKYGDSTPGREKAAETISLPKSVNWTKAQLAEVQAANPAAKIVLI